MKFFLDFCINERKPNILFVIYMTTQNMNKKPNWTLEDVDSEDEMEIDDNTSLKFSSLTSSSPRSSPRSTTTSPRTTTASPRTTTSSPFPQYDELNIDISNIEATPIDEKIDTTVKNDDKYIEKEPQEELLLPNVFRVTDEVERMRRRKLNEQEHEGIKKYLSEREPINRNEYLSDKIEQILNNKPLLDFSQYVPLLKKLIDKNYKIREDVLDKMKKYDSTNINFHVIEEILNYYNNKTGGKRYTRKTKKSNKKTKKIPGKFRKHKKSRKTMKSRKFPRKFQNAIKKKR
jgi:hypothetical protein